MQRDVCFSAFAVFDQDGDGRITLDELKQWLGEALESSFAVVFDPFHPFSSMFGFILRPMADI